MSRTKDERKTKTTILVEIITVPLEASANRLRRRST